MIPNGTHRSDLSEFTPSSYPCFGHSYSPTSFYLSCTVTTSAPGHRHTSCSASFMLQHTEVYLRYLQISVRSAQFFNLVTAFSKKNSYLTVFSITLTIYHCVFLEFCLKINCTNSNILKFALHKSNAY